VVTRIPGDSCGRPGDTWKNFHGVADPMEQKPDRVVLLAGQGAPKILLKERK
jgi:hypothetical protein